MRGVLCSNKARGGGPAAAVPSSQGPTRTPGHLFAPSPKVTEATGLRPALASILETRHSLLGKTGKEEPASRSGHLLRCPIYSLCTQGLKHGSTCSTRSPLHAAVTSMTTCPCLGRAGTLRSPQGGRCPEQWRLWAVPAALGCSPQLHVVISSLRLRLGYSTEEAFLAVLRPRLPSPLHPVAWMARAPGLQGGPQAPPLTAEPWSPQGAPQRKAFLAGPSLSCG